MQPSERVPADARATAFVRAVAAALLATSLLMLAAWLAPWPAVLRFSGSGPAMVFNTALLLAVSAAGLFAGASRRFEWQSACGAAVLAIAVPSALQTILQRDLGIDRLFIDAAAIARGWSTGRMAPSTALALTLVGETFLAAAKPRVRSTSAGLSGFALIALGGFALIERAFGAGTPDGWGLFTTMAVSTAASIFACGVALLCLGWRDSDRLGQLPVWLPFAAAASVCVVAAFLAATLGATFPGESEPLVFVTCAGLGSGLAVLTGASARLMQLARERAVLSETAAAALARSEQRLSLAIRNARQGLWDWDVRSGQVFVDGTCAAILGDTAPEQALDFTSFTALVHPDDRARVLAAIDHSLASDDVPYDAEYRIARGDGTWAWINACGRVHGRDARGAPLRLMGTIRDITERKQAQQALHEQEARYRLIVDAASDLIYRTDEQGRFTFVNAAAERVLERSADTLHGQEYLVVIRPDAREAARSFYERQGRERLANTYYEFPVVTGSGAEIWLGQNVQLLVEGGRLIGFQGVARDITERKRMERELQQARDDALDSVRVKAEFLANMSHEIRTPMNGVIGFTDLLLDTPLGDEQRKYVNGIRTSGDALLGLVNDILDFSKIEAGMLHVETVDFDLHTTIDNTLQLFVEAARRKGIDVAASIDDDVPWAVRGDPGRLRQVLTNLAGNAVKFTSRGGVTVRVTREEDRDSTVIVRFAVIDTGIGIPADAIGRLFQAFVQADGSTTRRFGGTGLGLAISKRLVELMGGAIGVESTPEIGSTFWFTLPLATRPAVDVIEPAIDLSGLRALVIDDEPANRTVLTHYLRAWGLIVAEAEDGAQALTLLRDASAERRPFDVALLDLVMPGLDGFTLARAIKADRATRSVRLVLMPSSGRRGHGRDARDAGIAAYLPKPVRQNELRACLSAIVAECERGPTAGEQPADARLITRYTLEESRLLGERPPILVAEDNTVNQVVTRGMLEKLGYRVDVVEDGVAALEALDRQRYAAVLMDCQMPRLDGFSTTAEIRRREGQGRHTPIVALTAHALAGERERCLEAGMDDYLSKPIARHELAQVLDRWVRATDLPAWMDAGAPSRDGVDASVNADRPVECTGTASAPGLTHAPDESPIDVSRLEAARAEVGELLASLVDSLAADAAQFAQGLREARSVASPADLERGAHRLKGSCSTLGFQHLAAAFAEIERLAAAGRLPDPAAWAGRLERERERVLTWWKMQAGSDFEDGLRETA